MKFAVIVTFKERGEEKIGGVGLLLILLVIYCLAFFPMNIYYFYNNIRQ